MSFFGAAAALGLAAALGFAGTFAFGAATFFGAAAFFFWSRISTKFSPHFMHLLALSMDPLSLEDRQLTTTGTGDAAKSLKSSESILAN